MSITRFFESLGAPLANSRWSWGARRPSDGAMFLRAWEDRRQMFDGIPHMMLDHRAGTEIDGRNLGYRERRKHIEAIRRGAPCFLIVCKAVDADSSPRKILSFNSQTLLQGGRLLERDGCTWIEVVRTVPVSAVRT
jgi:hypothetical protein